MVAGETEPPEKTMMDIIFNCVGNGKNALKQDEK